MMLKGTNIELTKENRKIRQEKKYLDELTIDEIKNPRRNENVEIDWKQTLLNLKDIAVSLFYIFGCFALFFGLFWFLLFLGVK